MTAFATVNFDQPANVLANATGKPLLADVAGNPRSGAADRHGRPRELELIGEGASPLRETERLRVAIVRRRALRCRAD
jgi:hypothetical protein